MPLPLLIPAVLAVSTIASLATPFFFPTEQDKATIELNKKLSEGNFTITKTQSEIKVPNFSDSISETFDTVKQQLGKPENSIFIILAIVAIIIFVVIL